MAGYFSPRLTAGFSEASITTGPFALGEKAFNYYVSGDAGEGYYMNFDPSLVSAEYVNGASVRQASLQTLVCIKL